MAETVEEKISRVRMMADDDGDWDLSPNDRAALAAVLEIAEEKVAMDSIVEAARRVTAWAALPHVKIPESGVDVLVDLLRSIQALDR